MSTILKGIDIPTNGETLVVGIYGDGNVSIEHLKPLVLAIEPNCQAIQIPKDHGRIGEIDRVWNDEGGEQFYDEPVLLEAET